MTLRDEFDAAVTKLAILTNLERVIAVKRAEQEQIATKLALQLGEGK